MRVRNHINFKIPLLKMGNCCCDDAVIDERVSSYLIQRKIYGLPMITMDLVSWHGGDHKQSLQMGILLNANRVDIKNASGTPWFVWTSTDSDGVLSLANPETGERVDRKCARVVRIDDLMLQCQRRRRKMYWQPLRKNPFTLSFRTDNNYIRIKTERAQSKLNRIYMDMSVTTHKFATSQDFVYTILDAMDVDSRPPIDWDCQLVPIVASDIPKLDI